MHVILLLFIDLSSLWNMIPLFSHFQNNYPNTAIHALSPLNAAYHEYDNAMSKNNLFKIIFYIINQLLVEVMAF